MIFKILLVEDNAIIADATKNIISTLEDFVVQDIAHNYSDAIAALQMNYYDLAIVDVNLSEEKTGIDVAQKLNEIGVPFIFLTAYSDKQTLAKALIYNPSGYVVKPVNKSNLFANLEILRLKYLNQDKLIILNGQSEIDLKLSHIRYIRSCGNYCEIHTIMDKILIRSKLIDYPKENIKLIRVHKSYVVHEAMIDKKTKKQITLKCGSVIPISPTYF